jgi:acyl carrier protein
VSCIAEVFSGKGQEAPVLSLHTPLDGTLGLDSLDYAELVVRLEGAFGVDPFASGAVSSPLNTVGDLLRLYTPDRSN